MAVLEEAMEVGQKVQRERAIGQESLFGAEEIISHNGNGYGQLPALEEWAENILLGFEKEALGFYITGHPLARHGEAIRRFATCDTAGLAERADKEEVRVCGIVAGLKELTTKKGDRMAFVTLEDLSGFVEMVVFPEVYQAADGTAEKRRAAAGHRHAGYRRGNLQTAGHRGRLPAGGQGAADPQGSLPPDHPGSG